MPTSGLLWPPLLWVFPPVSLRRALVTVKGSELSIWTYFGGVAMSQPTAGVKSS